MKNTIPIKNNLFDYAFEFIKHTDFTTLKDGRIELENGIWANLQTYLTKDDAHFEAHKKYIDIQYIIEGVEKISVASYSDCELVIPYDKDKDIEFLSTTRFKNIEMYEGDFLILYPEDAHRPSITLNNNQSNVRKLVIKVPVI